VGIVMIDWKKIAGEAWSGPSWKAAAVKYHADNPVHPPAPIPQRWKGPCDICGCEPCPTPVFCGVSRAGDRNRKDADPRTALSNSTSLETLWEELNRAARERYNAAPESTYQAAFCELSRHGVAQLGKANCQRRLDDLSIAQLKRLMVSLQQRRSLYPGISDELLMMLGEILNARTDNE
jgi:hypothetical protein